MKTSYKKLLTPTPIFLLGIIILIIGIPCGLYGLTLKGGSSLGGVLILLGMLLVFFLVAIDRLLIFKINLKQLVIAEIVSLFVGTIVYTYSQREISIFSTNPTMDYFVVIKGKDLIPNSYTYKFPFDKLITTPKNFVVISDASATINFSVPKNWNDSYSYNIYSFKKYSKVYVFGNTNRQFKIDEKTLDSLFKNYSR